MAKPVSFCACNCKELLSCFNLFDLTVRSVIFFAVNRLVGTYLYIVGSLSFQLLNGLAGLRSCRALEALVLLQ